jgi:NAD(P)-dependent dehydrogenase (short-subunit alcohol dehydrogenase family)
MTDDRPVALVTGAARGLGREVARRLADDHLVVISAREPDAAADAADELNVAAAGVQAPGGRALGVRALPVGLDIGDPASVAAAVDALSADPGRLDVLVNNAAAYVDWAETGTGADLDAARAVMEVNLFGAWRLVQAALPLLRRSPHPRIVNVSSGAGSHGDPAFGLAARGGAAATYGISKAALNALTSTLAAELAGTSVLVNAVCPGLTATYPGAEAMGARPVEESAEGVVWAARLPDDGPRGGLFRDARPLPW